MHDCGHCQEVLVSPLACGACEHIFPVPETLSPFEVFGMEPVAHIDRGVLRKRLLKLQRLLHPDFHGQAGDAKQELAEHNTAELNAAYEVLHDEAKRASFLIQHLGGPNESAERQMPQAFLMEVMEWNEALEELRDAGDGEAAKARAQELHEELKVERVRLLDELLDGLHDALGGDTVDLVHLRKQSNAIRYIDRALKEASELQLRAAS